MVDIMRESWEGLLVERPSDPCSVLPCPADLRKRILVKVKGVAAEGAQHPPSSATCEGVLGSKIPDPKLHNLTEASEVQQRKKGVVQALSALGVYTHSYHFTGLASPEAIIPTHVFSLSEKQVMEVHGSQGPTLISHNKNFLMRAFPSGTRVTSSNLDPAFFWRKGVQMVALNWQSCDAGMMLNEGMFAGSGGWVLKPEGYRGNPSSMRALSAATQAEAAAYKTFNLNIEVFAAQDLPLPSGEHRSEHFHPYVKCELHVEKPAERNGAPVEGGGRSQDGEHKRWTKASRGTEPDFGGENLHFEDIAGVVESLSFIR